MRRRELTFGLLLAGASWPGRAQEPAKQHRIAFIAAGPVARIHDPGVPATRTFWDELSRLGHVEGENLTVDAYSGGGRPDRYADLAREVVNRNPEVIVASTDAIARAVRAASGTIPIVWTGGIRSRLGWLRAWRVQAAISPASRSTPGTKSGGNASGSSRKQCHRHPRSCY